jgi:hypothetical protein
MPVARKALIPRRIRYPGDDLKKNSVMEIL